MIILAVAFNVVGIALSDGTFDERSLLEGRAYQDIPELSSDALASGDFQSQSESFLADHVPKRIGILVYNAAIQERIISLANLPFSFPATPTRFGSSVLVVPEHSALVYNPFKKSKYDEAMCREAFSQWESFLKQFPNSKRCVAMVDRPNTTLASPAQKLVAETANYNYFRAFLTDALDEIATLPDLSYTDADTFFTDYYKTDHHWQIRGAVGAYEKIMLSLDLDAMELDEFVVAYKGPFYGSLTRNGLYAEYSDEILDVDYEASAFTVKVNGETADQSVVDESLAQDYEGYSKSQKYANAYAEYFHSDWALLEFENPAAPEGTLLIIGDSYTNCMDRLFAETFKHVCVVDPRHYDKGITDYAAELDPDYIIVIMGADNLTDSDVLSAL